MSLNPGDFFLFTGFKTYYVRLAIELPIDLSPCDKVKNLVLYIMREGSYDFRDEIERRESRIVGFEKIEPSLAMKPIFETKDDEYLQTIIKKIMEI